MLSVAPSPQRIDYPLALIELAVKHAVEPPTDSLVPLAELYFDLPVLNQQRR